MTAVVVLPGLDGTAALLEAFCHSLGRLGVPARAISYPPDRPLGYADLEPLVRSELPAFEPFVLLGESFSGPLAIRIAASPPPGLVGLVLSTTFARAPVPLPSPLASLIRFAPARPPMPLLSWALLGRNPTSDLRAQLAAALSTVSPAVLRARAAAALRVDVMALLPAVTVPTLQLLAGNDRLLARSASTALAGGLPACRSLMVPGPHLLLQTATKACAQEVAAFALGLGPNNSFKPKPLRGSA